MLNQHVGHSYYKDDSDLGFRELGERGTLLEPLQVIVGTAAFIGGDGSRWRLVVSCSRASGSNDGLCGIAPEALCVHHVVTRRPLHHNLQIQQHCINC